MVVDIPVTSEIFVVVQRQVPKQDQCLANSNEIQEMTSGRGFESGK